MRPALLITLLISASPAWALDTDLDGVPDPVDPAPNDILITGYQPPWLYTFNGARAGDQFGTSVSGAGDVNNDGYADVVVGAYLDDKNGSTDSGSVRIFNGANGAILRNFGGDSPYDYFGQSVSGAGDVNKDGYADVVVGAYGEDNNGTYSGSAYVFSGANGWFLYTFNGDSAEDYFGQSVSGAGDVNGDGYADVLVGAYKDDNNGKIDSGSARIFSGANGAILHTFNGDSASDAFGWSVGSVGDVNKDGYADVVVGARYDDNNGENSGSARVFSGANGATIYTFNGDNANDEFGRSVSGAGDINNDGYADLIVGACQDDNNGTDSGSARVFSGKTGAILYTFNGDSAGDNFGISVSGAGDINNDGLADVVVGAHGDSNNGSASGSARIFSGADGAILYTFNGDSYIDYFGFSVSGAGDVNKDGYADVVVGARYDDNNGGGPAENSGSARIFSGSLFLQQTADADADGQVDTLDTDDDADGTLDVSDLFPQDTDNDGIPNASDADDDNDGVPDYIDAVPLNAAVHSEKILPLDSGYRGSSVREQAGVQ